MNSGGRIRVLVGIEEKYARDKIVECFKHRTGYYEVTVADKDEKNNDVGDFDLYWLEYEDLDFERLVMPAKTSTRPPQLMNSYCIRKGLIRKAQLAFYLHKYMSKKPTSRLGKFVPPTYVFQLDYLDYIDEALNDIFEVEEALKQNLERKPTEETQKFILKSSMTNKGAEMLIFDTRAQLEAYFERRVRASEDETLDLREWVIQEYVDRPLLLRAYNGRKFHLRVYVVAVANLRVYVYRDILALFSYKPYAHTTRFDDNNHIDMASHITNTCVQMDEATEAERARVEAECVKRFWELELDHDAELNHDLKNAVYEQVKQCVGELFECLSCEPTVFQPLANAFELYGLDFLVDDKYRLAFLEANAFPDFKQTGSALDDLIDRLFYQTIGLACDPYFGIQPACQTDMLSLVFSKQQTFK